MRVVGGVGPFTFFPFLEDLVEARRRSLIVDDLGILARDLEVVWPRDWECISQQASQKSSANVA
jgi:hypothetical protein